jgi:hypothetical protein
LFKIALIDNENLKSIDVICLDKDDAIKNRYQKIFVSNKFRFANKSIGECFDYLVDRVSSRDKKYNHADLEFAHNKVFE